MCVHVTLIKENRGHEFEKEKKEYIGRFVVGKREGINALIIVSKGENWEKILKNEWDEFLNR